MKKYLLGLSAIVIAVSAVAFTTPLKPRTTFDFHYTATSYGSGDVSTNTNWAPGAGTGCGGTQDKACKMSVDASFTHVSGSDHVLNDAISGGSILSISTALGADNTNYVPVAVAGQVSAINSKP